MTLPVCPCTTQWNGYLPGALKRRVDVTLAAIGEDLPDLNVALCGSLLDHEKVTAPPALILTTEGD